MMLQQEIRLKSESLTKCFKSMAGTTVFKSWRQVDWTQGHLCLDNEFAQKYFKNIPGATE